MSVSRISVRAGVSRILVRVGVSFPSFSCLFLPFPAFSCLFLPRLAADGLAAGGFLFPLPFTFGPCFVFFPKNTALSRTLHGLLGLIGADVTPAPRDKM